MIKDQEFRAHTNLDLDSALRYHLYDTEKRI